MTLADDIRRDIAEYEFELSLARTNGRHPFAPEGHLSERAAVNILRRKARVEQLEAAILAADDLARVIDALCATWRRGVSGSGIPEALDAFKKAQEKE